MNWELVETVTHPSGREYYTWKAVTQEDRPGSHRAGETFYNITESPMPPTTDAGYYSYAYLLKVKGIIPGTTLTSLFTDFK